MTKSRIATLAICGVLALAGAATSAQSASLMAYLGWETGNLSGTKQVRTNVPVVTTERARAGKYSMKAVLKAEGANVVGGERNELQIVGSDAPMNTPLWYGFSVFLPSDYVADNVWELVTQWYPYGDDDAEWGRQPVLALFTTKGVWTLANKSSPEVSTPINHPSISTRQWDFGPLELNRWTDWVLNVKWTHKSDGFFKVWKDGKLVLDYKGPTSYNDKRGPFVKQGMYKGWAKMKIDKVTTRTVYHDEFRMAGPDGSYEAVAPGGGKATPVTRAVPAPPTGLVIH